MKKTSLYKSIWREIFASKARFFSIMGIILLGVCFYAGIKATGPNMLKSADHYFSEKKLMDQQVISTMGITDEDVTLLEQANFIKEVVPGYSVDLNMSETNRVVRFFSLPQLQSDDLNQYEVVSGRLPNKPNEIALDNLAFLLGEYKLGESFEINKKSDTKEIFEVGQYKVVGFVNSPLYVENMSRGNTQVGKGSIDYFAVLPETEFNIETYTSVSMRFKETDKATAYSKQYDHALTNSTKEVEKLFSKRGKERLASIKEEAKKPLDKAKLELTDGQIKLAKAKKELREGEKALGVAEKQGIPDVALTEMTKKIAIGKSQIEKEERTLRTAEVSLSEKEQELTKLKAPKYFYLTRDDNPGYTEYQENAKRISSIATVFPVFFFMIAALVSLTTMTRMVEEKRSEIGTLKALGYRNWEISLKYIIYATMASLLGAILGLVIGFNVFPKVIIDAYGALYNLPQIGTIYYWNYSMQSVSVALMCTLLSALVVLRYDLFSTPASLMRPKAPKAGKRILLERVTFIWRRFDFNQKVTARNLFRYKQRMFMTIFGIAGCMALIITGFGLRDSISDVVELQFNKLWHYQGVVTYNENSSKTEEDEYQKLVKTIPEIKQRLILSQQAMEVKKENVATQKVTVNVPNDTSKLPDFMLFNNRQTGEVYQLDETGAIVNEKLAKLFKVKAGDYLQVSGSDNQLYDIKIAHVVENYAMHFIYMTPAYYQKVMKEAPTFNSELLLLKEQPTQKREDDLSEKLMAAGKIANVTFLSQTSSAMDDTISSLNVVVWVLITSAAALAFIVLYNLTNINISERIRELSTIKVLGFYNKEVTMYVYRENNILTVLGILVGCGVGKLLHGFVLETAEVDMLMFSPTIHGVSYLYSALLTALFSLLVMIAMHQKLKKVDMIEALKSNE
ncbi:FtsX-like permease family protein [Vagococcus intermedius]|uniref:FtsX-like permease family protein n=1 Tax=Vagococcus intermedius TaxID=2991418 RepID=A0AAF0CVZ0_9ENTE|nr:FtsX-like permease family protein [Vagococcus intermedius]WEG73879.1 FtsX-like permease family protein [Vagococcus intermedius]WEG75964.1 FtsX-like permease family protein [Vagococcus intermedius]